MSGFSGEISEVDEFLAQREGAVPGLRPGVEKRVVWAGAAGERTALSVVYVHGFSATSEEIRPLPDEVARALGANLHYARLSGHGQDGAAMGAATAQEWLADAEEALAIGRTIGEQVIVISCSTGSTLVTSALGRDASGIAGAVFVSPNYGMTHPVARFLTWAPYSRQWAPIVTGRWRQFRVHSPEHEAFWTVRYPTVAVATMADAMRVANRVRVEEIDVPALFIYCEADKVVSPRKTRAIISRWGGRAEEHVLAMGPGDDAMGHLIIGDVFSPGQVAGAVARVLAFLK